MPDEIEKSEHPTPEKTEDQAKKGKARKSDDPASKDCKESELFFSKSFNR